MTRRHVWVALPAILFSAASGRLLNAQQSLGAVTPTRTIVRSLARLGFANGLSLEGPNAERTVAFRVPALAHLDSARLSLRIRFPRPAVPQSNIQVFVNGTRRAVALRSQADSAGALSLEVPLPRTINPGDFATVAFRSSVTSTPDRCLDDRLALSFVEIDSSSSLSYSFAPSAIATIRQAWAVMPDTVTIALPSRQLTADEFRAAMTIANAATNEGRAVSYARLPARGDVIIASSVEVTRVPGLVAPPSANRNLSLVRFQAADGERVGIAIDPQRGVAGASFFDPLWTPLGSTATLGVTTAINPASSPDVNPTFEQLRLTDLQRAIGTEATWRLSLDLRDMPAGRVPSRVELRVVTAPNTNDRQLVMFVFLNGTLVRSMDLSSTGNPQLVEVRLPSSLLATRNELRVVMQRHLPAAQVCSREDAGLPAQILPSSRVITTSADPNARVFSSVAARLSSTSPLYLPSAALREPERYLPIVTAVGRAFWTANRAPIPRFFDQRVDRQPGEAFVVIGRPPRVDVDGPVTADSGRLRIRQKESNVALLDVADLSGWSIAQVVRWNSQYGVQLLPAAGRRRIPDWPDAYGNSTLTLADADSTLFQLNTAGREGALLFNDGPTFLERLRGDWLLWAAFIALLIVPPLYLSIRAVVRRTPRRRLTRRLDRPVPPSTA
jgi:hypothetical protein